MRIKEFFNKKINVAWVTAVLIMIAILTVCVATSHSKYVLEKELTFNLGIIESDEWNKRTLITGEELNKVLKDTGATQVVFGKKADFSNEIESVENSIAVGVTDETKSFTADDIKLYAVTDSEDITTAYILSEYQIKANADSSKMFYNYETLTNIFFLNFETSIVENMDSMFYGCKNLTELDLSKFETSKLINIANMFYDDILLETIYVSELWDLSGIETTQENVFLNCENLVGGNNTKYDATKVSSDYACIDTAEDGETAAIHGYFTYKSSVTEEQVTFNLVRPNVTENTTTTNTSTSTNTTTSNDTETTTQSDSSNETNTNKDKKENETGTETETENETETNTETDTDTNTETNKDTNIDNNNTDSNGDTSLDDDITSNDSTNTKEDTEETKENTELEQEGENVDDENVEKTTVEENIEDNGIENTITE